MNTAELPDKEVMRYFAMAGLQDPTNKQKYYFVIGNDKEWIDKHLHVSFKLGELLVLGHDELYAATW